MEWWLYVLGALGLLLGCLLLNFIVMKLNEARSEERFNSLQKASTSHSTQVQGNLIENETVAKSSTQSEKSPPKSDDSSVKPGKESTQSNVEESDENKSVRVERNESSNEDKQNYLGNIYGQQLTNSLDNNCGSKFNLYDTESNTSIMTVIVDKLVTKIKQSSSSPSIKKLIDIENEKELEEWVSDIIEKRAPKGNVALK